jgi:hypothetical protein
MDDCTRLIYEQHPSRQDMAIVTASITFANSLLTHRLARLRTLNQAHHIAMCIIAIITLQCASSQCDARYHKHQSALSWGCTETSTVQTARRWSPARMSLTQCSPCRRIAHTMAPTPLAPEAASTGCNTDFGPCKSCDRHSKLGLCNQFHRIARSGGHMWQRQLAPAPGAEPPRQRRWRSTWNLPEQKHTSLYAATVGRSCIWPQCTAASSAGLKSKVSSC